MLIIPTNLVCLLFSTAIPTSLFKLNQLFFILVDKFKLKGIIGLIAISWTNCKFCGSLVETYIFYDVLKNS